MVQAESKLEGPLLMSTKLELKFFPDWRMIRQLRTFVNGLLTLGVSDLNLATGVAMAITELAENAVKYATSAESVIRLRILPEELKLRIESENDATPENIRQLQRIIEDVNVGDPADAYARAMQAAAHLDSGSQLGMARIRCEAGMTLSCEIDNNRVRIVAERSL